LTISGGAKASTNTPAGVPTIEPAMRPMIPRGVKSRRSGTKITTAKTIVRIVMSTTASLGAMMNGRNAIATSPVPKPVMPNTTCARTTAAAPASHVSVTA
jgi:hypothetical protein